MLVDSSPQDGPGQQSSKSCIGDWLSHLLEQVGTNFEAVPAMLLQSLSRCQLEPSFKLSGPEVPWSNHLSSCLMNGCARRRLHFELSLGRNPNS